MKSPDERLHGALGNAGGPEPTDEALQALARAARAELAAQPKPRPWWTDALVVLALNLVMGVGAAAAMSWSTQQHASPLIRSGVAAAWLVLMAFGSVLWLRPGRPLGRWAVAGTFVAVSGFTMLGASGFDPGNPFFAGIGCAFVECGVAVIPLAAALLVSTRFAASDGHVFIAGLTAATGGALALHLHCPNGTLAHLAMFHLLPAVVLGGLAVVVRRLVRPKSFVP